MDAEWQILYDKLEALHKSGAKVVLSKLPIGDVATQYFADRDMFCAGRVPEEDLRRTQHACGGSIITTVTDIEDSVLGSCGAFEEIQIGGDRLVLGSASLQTFQGWQGFGQAGFGHRYYTFNTVLSKNSFRTLFVLNCPKPHFAHIISASLLTLASESSTKRAFKSLFQ